MSTAYFTRMHTALARALSVDDVNQVGRDTGQSERLRTITPHRLFLSMISALAAGTVESLADLLRGFNHHNGVTVAYKAFYNRLARPGFAKFMRQMFKRLIERSPSGRSLPKVMQRSLVSRTSSSRTARRSRSRTRCATCSRADSRRASPPRSKFTRPTAASPTR